MVKEYNIDKKTLKFESTLHAFNDNKSWATISPPFPGLRKLGIEDAKTNLIITIKKKED